MLKTNGNNEADEKFNHKGHKVYSQTALKKRLMNENDLAKIVLESGLRVHRALCPGLLESAYEQLIL
jgi:hypothetical protein